MDIARGEDALLHGTSRFIAEEMKP